MPVSTIAAAVRTTSATELPPAYIALENSSSVVPRASATSIGKAESMVWKQVTPSSTLVGRPASSKAARAASTAIASGVRPELRVYAVRPIPTIALRGWSLIRIPRFQRCAAWAAPAA